jgi:hypothetical protein
VQAYRVSVVRLALINSGYDVRNFCDDNNQSLHQLVSAKRVAFGIVRVSRATRTTTTTTTRQWYLLLVGAALSQNT